MSSAQWVRLDVGYLTNPKIIELSDAAVLMHLASILYLGLHRRSTGLLPPKAVESIALQARVRRPAPVIAELVEAELWHETPLGGWLVHDYAETNGVASETAAAKYRKRRQRERERDDD